MLKRRSLNKLFTGRSVKPHTIIAITSLIIASGSYASNTLVKRAKVLTVSPITEMVTEHYPVQICREVKKLPKQVDKNKTVGGVVGALIGSRLGRSSKGRLIGATVGAIVGSEVASSSDNNKAIDGPPKVVCHQELKAERFEKVTGYKVVYFLFNQENEAITSFEPSDTIDIAITMAPVIDNRKAL
ncbi:MAG: glycine zipper 2TM domain-containing protein [Kangiellaceae bacterium]|jgi:uncharacterized protein YcfJ|nr:glycine zipper 2TM domain-containing protein [Kangiellaceae bacterium]